MSMSMFSSRLTRRLAYHWINRQSKWSRSLVSQEKKTHFGFEQVTEEEKFDKVKRVFSNVSKNYDLMNDVMSLGVHRCWKKEFIDRLDPIPGTHLLDVAGGTGDIAFRFLDRLKGNYDSRGSVVVCDFNEQMVKVGQSRALELGHNQSVEWVVGDAMKLPFDDNSFDAYTIAFGIRNVVDVNKALEEAFRVLKPGGMFLCLEFSQVNNPALESLYNWYSFNMIPVYGEVLAGDWKSYQYLVESIRQFPDQEDFKEMIKEAGFSLVSYENLTNGIVAIHSGFKSRH